MHIIPFHEAAGLLRHKIVARWDRPGDNVMRCDMTGGYLTSLEIVTPGSYRRVRFTEARHGSSATWPRTTMARNR